MVKGAMHKYNNLNRSIELLARVKDLEALELSMLKLSRKKGV
jgi:hypothetical protein